MKVDKVPILVLVLIAMALGAALFALSYLARP
jgi:hypothetical protein